MRVFACAKMFKDPRVCSYVNECRIIVPVYNLTSISVAQTGIVMITDEDLTFIVSLKVSSWDSPDSMSTTSAKISTWTDNRWGHGAVIPGKDVRKSIRIEIPSKVPA